MADGRTITANGIHFRVMEMGKGPLVLLLHGFPDTAHTWLELMPVLADAGYHAVAPFMRGYSPTSAPPDGDYSAQALGDDVLSLVAGHNREQAIVIGHDWGAFSAYMAAGMDPLRISKMITLAIPHPRAMRVRRLGKAWHFALFQTPGIRRWLAAGDFAAIERTWRRWSPHWEFTAAELQAVKACFGAPDGLQGPIAYYRHMPRMLTTASGRAMRAVSSRRCPVPTLTIWGARDGLFNDATFAATTDCFSGPYKQLRVAGAGHFVHREAPDEVARAILAFLGYPGVGA